MLMTAVWWFIIYHHTSNSMSDFVCLGHIHKMYILFIYYELMRKKKKSSLSSPKMRMWWLDFVLYISSLWFWFLFHVWKFVTACCPGQYVLRSVRALVIYFLKRIGCVTLQLKNTVTSKELGVPFDMAGRLQRPYEGETQIVESQKWFLVCNMYRCI